jgi:signal transduction histidine kinase
MNLDSQALQQQLQQTELAYQMTVATSQFKSGFLARIAHELRSPLNGLIGMHQLILSDLCDDPQEEREFIAQAHESALKLLKLIDQILEVARLEYGSRQLEVQPLQLSEVLEQVHNLTQTIAQDRGIRWSFTQPDPDLYVFADPTYLKQILVSLVETVLRFTSEGELQLSAQVNPNQQTVHIWIDAPYPPSAWSEDIDTLQAQEATQRLSLSDRLSPGLLLLMHQTLLEKMQGRLELISAATLDAAQPANPAITRLQCILPWVVPEA